MQRSYSVKQLEIQEPRLIKKRFIMEIQFFHGGILMGKRG